MSYYSYNRRGLDPVRILILINAAVFFLSYVFEIVSPRFYGLDFIPNLALIPGQFFSQPWTIFTSMFIHAGFWHIISNMLALYFFGTYLTELVGERKFLFVYFVGGITGGLFYVIYALLLAPFMRASAAVGASGAIFAIGGALAAIRPQTRVYIFPFPIPIPLWIAILIGFLVILPGIAWQAHLGGGLFGALAGLYFKHQKRL